jgi:hypothetical protein
MKFFPKYLRKLGKQTLTDMNQRLLDKHINGMDFKACENMLNYIYYLLNQRGVSDSHYLEMKNRLEGRLLETNKK